MKKGKRDKRRSSFVFGFGLLGVFAAFYFGSAMLNTAELKGLAAVTIWEIPLTIWMGLVTILSGLIITRIYLVKGDKS